MSAARRTALAGAALASAWLPSQPAGATPNDTESCGRHAPEAALRSRLPVDVILRVMRAESRGRSRAVSPKGAMGCMQIMPPTWVYLTARYGLGADPYDPRMNMIAGSLYLAELARQFGFPGAWSAYNAGPGRYIRHVQGGVPPPAETIAYTAQIGGGTAAAVRGSASGLPLAPRWQEASLFTNRTAQSVPSTVSRGPTDDATARTTHPLFPLAAPAREDGTGNAGS